MLNIANSNNYFWPTPQYVWLICSDDSTGGRGLLPNFWVQSLWSKLKKNCRYSPNIASNKMPNINKIYKNLTWYLIKWHSRFFSKTINNIYNFPTILQNSQASIKNPIAKNSYHRNTDLNVVSFCFYAFIWVYRTNLAIF